jgi:NitT/TauT family transport system ATP-binding protein
MSIPRNKPDIEILNLGVAFQTKEGDFWALRNISFSIHPQEFVCVLGPSGSGKTTLLRAIAGLLPINEGQVNFGGDGTRPRIGLMFQQANLLPWRNTMQNISLPLEIDGTPTEEAHQTAQEWVDFVGLEGFEHTWPRDLSGGMAQRVSLDEPFGSLDALTRERMGTELLNIWQNRRTTVLMVTHSIAEALLLADRILVLTSRPGKIQMDLPVEFSRPRSEEIRYSPKFGNLAATLKKALE